MAAKDPCILFLHRLLINAYLDAGDKVNAASVFNKSFQFLRDSVPKEFREAFAIAARNNFIDIAKFQKDAKLTAHLGVLFKLARLKAYNFH